MDAIEKNILCLNCRGTFSDKDIENASACPYCDSKNVPADLNKSSTITITHHELRILFMWADNWESQFKAKDGKSAVLIKSIAAELRKKDITIPSLSLAEEAQGLADYLRTKVELRQSGETKDFDPEAKH